VQPHAQKTDAKMMTRALLLSDDAEADNKPELEIFADDVTCGHGATTGALDESLLFYLRARGLSEKEAQALLIQAFVGEAVESIVNDTLRELAISAAQPRPQNSSTPGVTKRSSSPVTPPRRSISWRRHGASRTSRRVMKSCSRSWSTIPTSYPGISSGNAMASSSNGPPLTTKATF